MDAKYSEVKQLSLNSIKDTGNPRSEYSDSELNELAASIKVVGIIHPVTVISIKGGYRLIAGKRRYLASVIAEKISIDARVLENPTDEIIEEIQLIENCQRADISLLDESKIFVEKALKWSAAEIAARIGKEVRYVQDRLNLHYLGHECREALRANRITLLHALQLAKLTVIEQVNALNAIIITHKEGDEVKYLGTAPVHQLKAYIVKRACVPLKEAKFAPGDKSLVKSVGACNTCAMRSGCNKTLFNDMVEDDICFNPYCFAEKSIQHCIRLEKQLQSPEVKTVRLTGIYKSSNTEQHGLHTDFMLSTAAVEEGESLAGKTIGIYFEHHDKALIGTLVHIMEDKPVKKELAPVQHEKAIHSFRNLLQQAIGKRIGEYDCESIPLSVIHLLSIQVFAAMPPNLQEPIMRFYKWKNNSLNPDQNKRSIISNLQKCSYEDGIQFLLTCLLFDTLNNCALDSPEYLLISQLCIVWHIDLLALSSKIESEFDVKLKVIKTLL